MFVKSSNNEYLNLCILHVELVSSQLSVNLLSWYLMFSYIYKLFQCQFSCLHKGSFIYYVRKIFQITNFSYPLIHTPSCAYQEIGNVSFSQNFPNLVNVWPLKRYFLIYLKFLTQFISLAPWNIRKPLVFWCFQGV